PSAAGSQPADALPTTAAESGQSANSSGQTSGGAGQSQTKPWDRMIIRTATLQLTVKDMGASVNTAQRLAADHDGYVLQLDSHQEGKYTVSAITIQVPSQEFDKIMPELRK